MPYRCVVVADDVPEICNLVAKFLEPFGYTVLSAHSGREAMKLVHEKHCDVVVADVLMPDGDGIELINELKQRDDGVRILAISGGGGALSAHHCVERARAAGAHAAITKPFDRKQLLAAIETTLAN